MNTILKVISFIITLISTVIIIPPFLNFMEGQSDILLVKPQISTIQQENTIQEETIVENKEIVQEEPTPEEVSTIENSTPNIPVVEAPVETPIVETPIQPVPTPVVETVPVQTPVQEVVSNRDTTPRENWIQFTATGYCACSRCCGKTNGITSSGAKAVPGITVAMSSNYAFGIKIQLKNTNGNLMNGGNCYIVQDRGGAIKSNRIDIFFGSHQEALNFGRRTVYLKVVS